MIEGMKFHIKGSELYDLLNERSCWHNERVTLLKVKLKQAEDGMKAASEAASSALTPHSEVYVGLASVGGGAPQRAHGGNIENPVEAIRQAILFHTRRAIILEFFYKHIVVDATYVLNENEIQRYELIAGIDPV